MIKKLTFSPADFIESVSWVTQLLSAKEASSVFLEVKDDNCLFSFEDRSIYLQSHVNDVDIAYDVDSEDSFADEDVDNSDSIVFNISAEPLVRLIKAIPARAEKIVLSAEFSQNGNMRAFAVQAGNRKMKLPTLTEKIAPKRPQYASIATVTSKELFEAMAKAGNASNKEKGSNDSFAMLDFHVKKDGDDSIVRIFGTDSFVMNASELKISQDVKKETRILIPATYSSLPEFSSSAKVDEVIEIVKRKAPQGEKVKPALGFVFPNGFISLFNTTRAKPIPQAPLIFEGVVKNSTHYFDVDTKVLKTETNGVTSFNPEAEKIHFQVSEDNVIVSDGDDTSSNFEVEVFAKDGTADDDFTVHTLLFTKFVLRKMFNVIPSSRCRIYFSTTDNKALYVIPAPQEDKDSKGVEQESMLISESSIVVLYQNRDDN